MGTVVGSTGYLNENVRQLLQLIRVIITNANERTATEVSEITGIKPEYVDIILRLTSEIGVIEEKDGRFYVSEETRDAYDTVLTEIINSVPGQDWSGCFCRVS